MASITLSHILKTYGAGAKANTVIHDLNASIADGEFVVIVGPSGCGKSTLMNIIAGLEEPSGGLLRLEGRDITTVVFPNAQSRLLLTASEEVRLQRRSKELSADSASAVVNQVSKRDETDSKIVDFMNAAAGVTLVDSSNLDFDQTVSVMIAQIKADLKASAQ